MCDGWFFLILSVFWWALGCFSVILKNGVKESGFFALSGVFSVTFGGVLGRFLSSFSERVFGGFVGRYLSFRAV